MFQVCGDNPRMFHELFWPSLSGVCGLIPNCWPLLSPQTFFDDGINYYQGSEIVEGFDKVFIWEAAV